MFMGRSKLYGCRSSELVYRRITITDNRSMSMANMSSSIVADDRSNCMSMANMSSSIVADDRSNSMSMANMSSSIVADDRSNSMSMANARIAMSTKSRGVDGRS